MGFQIKYTIENLGQSHGWSRQQQQVACQIANYCLTLTFRHLSQSMLKGNISVKGGSIEVGEGSRLGV